MSGKSTSGHEMWWCAFMLACLSELRLDIKVMFAVSGTETIMQPGGTPEKERFTHA